MPERGISRREFIKLLGASGIVFSLGAFAILNFMDPRKKGSVSSSAAAQSAGSWVQGQNTTTIAIHASYLHTGQILYIGGSGYHQSHLQGPFEGRLLDPATGFETNVSMSSDLFCHGSVHLANGNLIIAGGTLQYDTAPGNCNGRWHGLKEAFEFNVASGQLVPVQSMVTGRWYPTLVILGDGKVATFNGFDEYGVQNRLVEIYDPASKTWSIKYDPGTSTGYCIGQGYSSTCPGAGSPCFGGTAGNGVSPTLSLYPRMHLMPSGLIITAGHYREVRSFDPASGSFALLTSTSTYRHYGTSVLLPLQNTAEERGEVLVVGGSPTSSATATSVVEIIDFNASSNNVPIIRTVQSIQYARKFFVPVILPDGKVVIFGGSSQGNANYVYYPEIFDPVTETWSVLPPASIPRTYHTVALLLKDGRVWVASSTPATSIWELRTEIFRPWYYTETRPAISGTPIVGGYGETITIPTANADDITSVSLLRLMSATHHYEPNQRFLWLQILNKTSNSVVAAAPLNSILAPPGYYMIHVINSSGVPSEARFIKIPDTGGGPPPGGETFYDVPYPGNAVGGLGAAQGSTRYGEEARIASSVLVGKSLKTLNVYLRRVGSASGNIAAVVRRSSDDTVVATFNETIDASTLPTSFAERTFTLTSAYLIQSGDRILVQYGGAGRIEVSVWTTDQIDGSNTRRVRFTGSSYIGGSTSDIAGSMSSDGGGGGDTTPPGQVTGLTVTTAGASQLNLAWNANPDPDIDHYDVHRSTVSGFSPSPANRIAQPAGASYSDTGLSSLTTYYYVVAAVDTSGNIGPASSEAAGTTSGASVAFYDVPYPGNAVGGIYTGASIRYGEEAVTSSSAIVGKALKKWTVHLRKAGSPSGPVTAVVRRASDDAVVATFNETLNAPSLPTSFAPFDFTLTVPYVIQAGDKLLVEYSGSSRVDISVWTTDQFDGSATRRTRYSGTLYALANTNDVVGQMSSA